MAIYKPIKVGIIGTGKVAQEYYLPEYANRNDTKIIAVANRGEEMAYKVAKAYGVENVYTGNVGWTKLIDRDDIDAITICTPNYLHAEMAIAAAKIGKHILVEKPMAVSLKEAEDMIQSAKENNVILMVSFPERFIPAHEEAKKIIESEILGKINIIKSVWGHSGPEFWSPSSEWFFEKKKASGGVLLDLGIHQADFICWLTGKRVKEVCAFTGILGKNIEIEDNAICLVKFEDGTIGSFYSSWTIRPNPENSFLIYCERGILEVNSNFAKPIKVLMDSSMKDFFYHDIFSIEHSPRAIGFSKLIEHFVRCIRSREKPLITGEDGLESLKIILAAYESANNKKIVRL